MKSGTLSDSLMSPLLLKWFLDIVRAQKIFPVQIFLKPLTTVSPLNTNLQVLNFQRQKHVLAFQSCKLVHISGIQRHRGTSFTSSRTSVYFTVQNCIEYSIKPRMSGSKRKSEAL